MAWQDVLDMTLRVMVNDFVVPTTYPDSSIEQVLVVAAQFVEQELDFRVTYFADVAGVDITPDPTTSLAGGQDNDFINLTCLKAGALFDQGQARTQSGIVIRDNGSMVDLSKKLQAALSLLGKGGFAEEYVKAKLAYQAGLLHNLNPGYAIIGSIRSIAWEAGSGGWETDAGFPPRAGEWGGWMY